MQGRAAMKLTLHHVNLVTEDVPRAESFWRDVMGLERPDHGLPEETIVVCENVARVGGRI